MSNMLNGALIGALVSALVSACVTIIVMFLSNRASERRLAVQLAHDSNMRPELCAVLSLRGSAGPQ